MVATTSLVKTAFPMTQRQLTAKQPVMANAMEMIAKANRREA
ncbi:hypothetical protein [Bacteroides caecimuris]|nr:hypothetical protein [Bacteroides caecimuris]